LRVCNKYSPFSSDGKPAQNTGPGSPAMYYNLSYILPACKACGLAHSATKFFMSHQLISLREANHNFSRLIAAVERGETFCITRRGQEVALLTRSSPTTAAMGKGRNNPTALPAPDNALGERVLRLETQLAKLSSVLPPVDP
jgi:prevent-host-death family protein